MKARRSPSGYGAHLFVSVGSTVSALDVTARTRQHSSRNQAREGRVPAASSSHEP